MRRIVMFNRVSADGYFADTNGTLDWVIPDPALDVALMSGDHSVDTILFGRRTYEMFASFWPHITKDTPDPHGGGPMSPELLEMAAVLNDAAKVVYSRTLTKPSWKNSRVLPMFNPREVEALKRQRGNDIMIFGSGSIVAQLTEHRLIDEYQLAVVPVMLGGGKTLMSTLPQAVGLDLVGVAKFPTGNVLLRFAPAADPGHAA